MRVSEKSRTFTQLLLSFGDFVLKRKLTARNCKGRGNSCVNGFTD